MTNHEPTRPPPPGWPRISSSLFYLDAAKAIDWLCEAFGFTVRLKVEGDGGLIEHSELEYGEGLIMVGDVRRAREISSSTRSPRQLDGANTQGIFIYVDDIEAHHARALGKGAVITRELSVSDYGEDYWSDRSYGCYDLEGHHWYFSQRLRSPAPKS